MTTQPIRTRSGWPRRAVPLALGGIFLVACSDNGGHYGGAEPDAGVDVEFEVGLDADAGIDSDVGAAPAPGVWRVGVTPTLARTPTCVFPEGTTAVLTIDVPIEEDCVYAGPVEIVEVADHELEVQAWRWTRDNAGCNGVTGLQTRDVPVAGLARGEWSLMYFPQGGVSQVDFGVGPPLEAEGTPPSVALGETCVRDTQCPAGSACIAVLESDFCEWQEHRCARPCSFSTGYQGYDPTGSDCGRGEACAFGAWDHLCEQRPGDWSCANLAFGGPPVCAPAEPCSGDGDCTGSLVCRANDDGAYCTWPEVPQASIGQICTDSTECPAAMECVTAGLPGTCQVRCQTADMTCPEGWLCQSPSDGAPWACRPVAAP